MFSGKTTELIRRLKRYRFADYRCMLIRYAKDDRYSSSDVATHDKQTLPAVSVVQLSHLEPDSDNYDVLGIDEGQFVSIILGISQSLMYVNTNI